MQTIDSVTSDKWRSLFLFFLIDAIQIFLVAFLEFDETLPTIVSFDPSRINLLNSFLIFLVICVFQIFYIYSSAFRMISQPSMIMIYPIETDPLDTSKYSAKELVEWTLMTAEMSGVKIDKIFFLNSPLPNAFTFSLPLFGSIVVIHSNTLDILESDEMKAIIAHEIGHIKNKDSLTSIFAQLPSFFIDIVYLYAYIRIGLGIANALLVQFDIVLAIIRIAVLIGFFILSRALMFIAKIFIQRSSRAAELLADYHAASVIGVLPMINGLLRIGQRVEAVSALIEEIRWLESQDKDRITPVSDIELALFIARFPLDGIDELNARNLAPYLFLTTRLKNMREVYGIVLSDEQIDNAVRPAARELLIKRKLTKTEDPARHGQIINWLATDTDGDRRISENEIGQLIDLLRKNPSKMMFQNEIGMNIYAVDHPDFRRRILFIADTFNL